MTTKRRGRTMPTKAARFVLPLPLAITVALFGLAPSPVEAHCDTLDGPVVTEAREALEARDVTLVLKWVGPARETAVREAFAKALDVRRLSPDARALADRFFFETLVRLHREGEGAPYTGLKPAGLAADPAIVASDTALRTGDIAPLIDSLARHVDAGLRARHARALEARAHANDSVEKGREYVAAYVDLMHYAEGLLAAADRAPLAPGGQHTH
jgi:hypothetical protein